MVSPDIVAALAGLAETAAGPFTVDELLRELCQVAVKVLDVDGAAVMVLEQQGVRLVDAIPQSVVDVEALQESLHRGPCHDAMVGRTVVALDDISGADRWPEFAAAADTAGLRSTMAMPLLARGQAWGALDLYRTERGPWSHELTSQVQMIAALTASFLVMAVDRDEAATTRETLEHRASHDALTGLPGRSLLFTLLEHALPTARRRRSALALLFLDLDGFKKVNDTFGHAAGDLVLIEAAQRLTLGLRASDTIVRLAGDEFVIICENLPFDPAAAIQQVEGLGRRVSGQLSRPMHVSGTELSVTVSIGVAVADDGSTPENLLADADNAMYRAKQRGRGLVVIADKDEHLTTRIPRQRRS